VSDSLLLAAFPEEADSDWFDSLEAEAVRVSDEGASWATSAGGAVAGIGGKFGKDGKVGTALGVPG
jgi:hypothetical protein